MCLCLIMDFTPSISARSDRVLRSHQPFDDRSGLIRMDRNEDVAAWEPDRLNDLLAGISPSDLAAYHDADSLEAKIAEWRGCQPGNILVTAGSSEALGLVFETYVDEGDTIVGLEPSYGLYEVFSAKCGGRYIGIPYDGSLNLDVTTFISQIRAHAPSLVVVANPNQPTGGYLSSSDLRQLATESLSSGAVLLVDEAYFLFCDVTASDMFHTFPNLVVTQTFSKAFGLAGLRVGYCVSSVERINEIQKLSGLTRSNALGLRAAEYVLDNLSWAMTRVEEVRRGRRFLIEELCKLRIKTFDSATNFVLLDCESLEDAESLNLAARMSGYAIRGPLRVAPVETCVRITAGPVPIMENFLHANLDAMQMHGRFT